jgi:hypothetical protein
MKPWQTIGKADVDKPKSQLSCDEQVTAINHIMKSSPGFWQEAGKKRARVCQFSVREGDADASWYVEVDASGGRAQKGTHPSAHVTWISDVDALRAAFKGTLLEGRVRVLGDFSVMREVFKAISQAKPA